jgi:hypothetical protein
VTLIIRKDRNAEPFNSDPPAPADDALPSSWSGVHVGLRLAEAHAILKWLPAGGDRMRMSMQTRWPPYTYEFEDRVAQQELADMQEIEHPRLKFSPVEIGNMNAALAWPLTYLRHHPELAEAVNALARAYSLGLDAGAVAGERGGFADDWRERHDLGCEWIAAGLERDRAAVF